jgi:hypothetical protein
MAEDAERREDEHHDDKGAAPAGDAAKKRQRIEWIVAGAAVLTAIFAYLLLKKPAASTTSTTPSATTVVSTPNTATPGRSQVSVSTPTGYSYTGPAGYMPTPGAIRSSVPSTTGFTRGTTPGLAKTTPVPFKTPTATKPQTPQPSASQSTHAYATLVPRGYGYSVGNYQAGTVPGSTGQTYATEATYTSTLAAFGRGTSVYIQTAPGKFSQVTKTQFVTMEKGTAGTSRQTTTYVKNAAQQMAHKVNPSQAVSS